MVILNNPDIGKTSVVSTRHLKLEDNVELDYSKEHYKKKLLFKENILHDTLIEIEITSIKEPSKLNLLLFKRIKSIYFMSMIYICSNQFLKRIRD